jgi:hypothetical protein
MGLTLSKEGYTYCHGASVFQGLQDIVVKPKLGLPFLKREMTVLKIADMTLDRTTHSGKEYFDIECEEILTDIFRLQRTAAKAGLARLNSNTRQSAT